MKPIFQMLQYIKIRLEKHEFIRGLLSPFYRLIFKKNMLLYNQKHFQTYSLEVLIMAKKALEELEVTFWLEFGTLLGVVRENDFIKHDSDLDIGVFLTDFDPEIEQSMIRHGFSKIRQFEIQDRKYGLEQTFEYKGIHLDIFYFTKKNNKKIISHCFAKSGNIKSVEIQENTIPKDALVAIEMELPFYGLEEIVFKGYTFNIPVNAKKHLEYHYGNDYLTPRNWDYTNLINDHKNAKIINEDFKIC